MIFFYLMNKFALSNEESLEAANPKFGDMMAAVTAFQK
jgi:hypothetical protein